MISRTMSPFEWGLLLLLSILWGGAFFFIKVALTEFEPVTLALLRVAIAALAMLAAVYASGAALPKHRSDWGAFAVMGLINNVVPFSLIAWGQTQIASGLASIVIASTPLFTVLLAHIFTSDEKLSLRKILGVLIGLAGVMVIFMHQAFASRDGKILGELAIVGAALSYACAGIYGRRFRRHSSLVVTAGQLSTSTLFLAPLAFAVEQPLVHLAGGFFPWAALLALALAGTAWAYILYFRILRTAGATNVLLVALLVPITATLLGCLILKESFELRHAAGFAIIVLGLAVIDGRVFRSVPDRAKPALRET